jgi:hypothetical protein
MVLVVGAIQGNIKVRVRVEEGIKGCRETALLLPLIENGRDRALLLPLS